MISFVATLGFVTVGQKSVTLKEIKHPIGHGDFRDFFFVVTVVGQIVDPPPHNDKCLGTSLNLPHHT